MKPAASLLCLVSLCEAASADVLWNELSQGDLSDNRFVPKAFDLSLGDNILYGVMAGSLPEGGHDLDYFSVTVPAGLQLSALVLDFYDSFDQTSFIAIQPGPIFPDDPATVHAGDLMGWMHFGPNQIGEDLLPTMATNGYGFTSPLPAGTYSFWCQQLDDYTDWTGRFVVTEVPAPSSLAPLLLLGPLWSKRRRSPGC